MFRLIVAKELREIISSTKFVVTFLVCSLLIILAFYVGARNYQIARNQYEMALSENLHQMESLTSWRSIDHRIFLPPQPLAALVTGIANDIGRNIQVQERGGMEAQDSMFNDDPIFAVFHFLDLDFIFQVILSLFTILFVYNTVNREKEQGTLRLTFSNAVPRNTYILGKVAGAFLTLTVSLLIPILLGCLLLILMEIPMSGNEWLRLGLVIVSGFLFLGAFATLSLFVSSVTHRSSTSFLILLVTWIFAVLIVPRTSVLLAGQTVDVISSDEMAYERIMQDDQDSKEALDALIKHKVTTKDMNAAVDQLLKYYNDMNDELAKKNQEVLDRLDERRRNEEARQQRIAFGLARISPASAFSLAATNMAGTSVDLKRHYMEEALRYREIYARFLREKEGDPKETVRPPQQKPKPINPPELPVFLFEQPSVKDVVRDSVPDLGVLAIFNIVFFAGAFTAFLRYDVR
jgi:ABC-type transport system involved in multi-copper enzyme maturation permease subunit